MLPQENFCLNKASAAGNTSRIVKGADKIMGKIALAECPSLFAPRAAIKKRGSISTCVSKFIPNKKGEALFPKAGFHLYSRADALE